jgi:hypothetical protein
LTDDAMAALVERMRPACARAVDADEIAAVLEASGINDRVAARDYDVTSVFSLAAAVLLRAGHRDIDHPLVESPASKTQPAPWLPLVDTLVRAALYLTPTVVALGAAAHAGGLPAVATKGALVFGWGASQALAFLGYCALGTTGRAGAARLLAGGFGAATLGWGVVLWACRAPWPTGYLVSAAQLALFAATAVALVTGTERRLLGWAVPCWLSAVAMADHVGPAADVGLLASLAAMVLVAYWPAVGRAGTSGAAGTRWPTPRQLFAAFGYGTVGTGQAVLFVLVVLAGASASRLPLDATPLLVGVPLIELLLLWHQRRVADGRATLDDRAAFKRHLVRAGRGTVAALCVPVAVGAALTSQPRLATAVLLTAVYALCLVLVTHRRLGTAAILVWWPAALIALTARSLPHLPTIVTHWVTGLTLFAACLPALVVVALVIRDPWSYR